MPNRGDELFLEDIRLSIKKIQKYIRGLSFGKFKKNGQVIDAVVRNLEIIGEAASNLSSAAKNRYSKVRWREIVSMRNKVVHEYFGVDEEILWKTITDDVAELKRLLKQK